MQILFDRSILFRHSRMAVGNPSCAARSLLNTAGMTERSQILCRRLKGFYARFTGLLSMWQPEGSPLVLIHRIPVWSNVWQALIPSWRGDRPAKDIQGSKLDRLKHASHFIMCDQSEGVTRNLLHFLHQYSGMNYSILVNLVPFGGTFS